MRLHNVLDKIVGHEAKAGILRILCEKNTGWTGRQLAKALAISPTTSSKVLKELADEGIVIVKGVGRSYLYHLDDKSYIVKNILVPFFEKEGDIVNQITLLIKKAVLKSGSGVETIAIFGSVASRTETPESDLDVVIIISKSADKPRVNKSIDSVFTIIARDFRAIISPYILSAEQFKKRYKDKDPIIGEMLKSYKLIYGKPLERYAVDRFRSYGGYQSDKAEPKYKGHG
jgi:predicted nucleotidyltransferase